jgi:chromosome segregation ATPase
MIRSLFPLLLVGAAFGQSTDAALTQTLINEIRALRQDLEATTVTSQRVQIALYRLQSQTAIVNTAQQRLDAAHARVGETESQRKGLAAQIQVFENSIRDSPDSPEKKDIMESVPRAKARLESLTAEEAARRGAEADAESQLRAEQARLADLQSLLDRLDKALEELSRPKK